VDRIGNPNPTVHTFRLIADVRIEKAIVARQKKRNALTEGVLDQTLINWLEEIDQLLLTRYSNVNSRHFLACACKGGCDN
jgi:hypothetical protein